MRSSNRGSGPTANGTRVATTKKKPTGSHAAPPIARRTSRAISDPIKRSAPAASKFRQAVHEMRQAPPRRVPDDPRPARSSRVDTIAIETVERFIEKPKRRIRCNYASERRALGLAGGKKANRHIRQARRGPSASIASSTATTPKAQRPPQRQFAIQRQPIVGETPVRCARFSLAPHQADPPRAGSGSICRCRSAREDATHRPGRA